MKCKSIIEIEKRIEKRKTEKKKDLRVRQPQLPDPGQVDPPFVPAWRSRLGNRDNKGFPTGTNYPFYSSGNILPSSYWWTLQETWCKCCGGHFFLGSVAKMYLIFECCKRWLSLLQMLFCSGADVRALALPNCIYCPFKRSTDHIVFELYLGILLKGSMRCSNFLHSSLHNVIEWAFRILKQK